MKPQPLIAGNNSRDKHLRGKDYFDAVMHPQIRITSTRVAKSITTGSYVLFAKLTIKGVTKEASFPFKAIQETGVFGSQVHLKLSGEILV